jgi:hypothetical protein
MLGKPIPRRRRREANVTKTSILFNYWVEISPFSYFRWRYNQLRARLGQKR